MPQDEYDRRTKEYQKTLDQLQSATKQKQQRTTDTEKQQGVTPTKKKRYTGR